MNGSALRWPFLLWCEHRWVRDGEGMKRVLMGLSIAVTLLWVLGVVVLSFKQYVAHRGLLDQLLETATFALVPAAALWGFLYTGFWVTRGSAG